MEYIAYLHKDRRSDFGVSFPDFPGCVTAGKTLDEARRLAPEALALHIKGMMEDGDPIPVPSTIDDLADDSALKGAVAFLVKVDISEKAERFNITARKSQMKEIDRLAEREGMTRSAYMVSSALARKAISTGNQSGARRRLRPKDVTYPAVPAGGRPRAT
jgi:predicted RNase H-like HicB family nuclease